MLRLAQPSDLPFLCGLSDKRKPSDDALRAQIRDGRLRIIEWNDTAIGFLKFSILWETLPFIEVIWLTEPTRGQDLGSRAVQEWEQEMKDRGFDLVLTSTAASETAQHFWRKLGYTDCGSLTVRNKAAELFLQKRLESPTAS
jgi:GNAT superfamily N-acetyltransferase